MLETPEARAKLRRKLESWPEARKSPVTINQGLELLDMVERLEREADWLAGCLEERDIADHYEGRVDLGEMRDKADWRNAARKAVADNE